MLMIGDARLLALASSAMTRRPKEKKYGERNKKILCLYLSRPSRFNSIRFPFFIDTRNLARGREGEKKKKRKGKKRRSTKEKLNFVLFNLEIQKSAEMFAQKEPKTIS